MASQPSRSYTTDVVATHFLWSLDCYRDRNMETTPKQVTTHGHVKFLDYSAYFEKSLGKWFPRNQDFNPGVDMSTTSLPHTETDYTRVVGQRDESSRRCELSDDDLGLP